MFVPADKHGDAALNNVKFGLLFLGQVATFSREIGALLRRAPWQCRFDGRVFTRETSQEGGLGVRGLLGNTPH